MGAFLSGWRSVSVQEAVTTVRPGLV